MRRRLSLLSVAVVLLTVGGPAARAASPTILPSAACSAGPSRSGDWLANGGDARGTRSQPAEHAIDAVTVRSLTAAWATHVGDGGPEGVINATPAEADGCVFVGTSAGDVVALDATTGRRVWGTHLAAKVPGLGGTIVGSTVVDAGAVYVLVNETGDGSVGPYAVALDEHTGHVRWRSAPLDSHAGSYTNASPAVIPTAGGKVVFAGWSPAEGDPKGQGGFVLLDARAGTVVVKTQIIPATDQAAGYAGAGIWAPPVLDPASGFGFVGASNPYSKVREHERTNAILKIDLRRRGTPSFGQVVGSYKGAPDQYLDELRALSQSPACAASDTPAMPYPLDDPVCGQLDLDFGAPLNVFTLDGRTVVGGLQKAGIYHLVDAATMKAVWTAKVGGPCQACNAAATAVGPDGVAGVSSPGGTAFTLGARHGDLRWAAPVGDGSHYMGVSVANGVFYTTDNAGFLDVYDAATGALLLRHPMTLDTMQPTAAFSSAGLSIARGAVFVAASSGSPTAQAGWVIAYRLP